MSVHAATLEYLHAGLQGFGVSERQRMGGWRRGALGWWRFLSVCDALAEVAVVGAEDGGRGQRAERAAGCAWDDGVGCTWGCVGSEKKEKLGEGGEEGINCYELCDMKSSGRAPLDAPAPRLAGAWRGKGRRGSSGSSKDLAKGGASASSASATRG